MKNQQHKFLVILESFVYSSGQLLLGLLLHPYRTTQLLVRHKVLLPFVLYPSIIGLLLSLTLEFDFFNWLYQTNWLVQSSYQFICFFCFYWQLALLYLWFRFSKVFDRVE